MRNQAPFVSPPATEEVAPADLNAIASRDLVSAFKNLWMRGTPVDVNSFLAEHPELAGQKSAVLDLAYEEYCQRREKGLAVDADAFCEALPRFKTSLRRLLEADRCLAEYSGNHAGRPLRWPEPGDHFLGFALKAELGRGAFSRVFLATESALGDRHVAVKITLHGAAEAGTLGRLSHRNVVQVYSVQKEELSGLTVICMPYLGRATLCDVLDCAFSNPGLPASAKVILEAIDHQISQGEPPPGQRSITSVQPEDSYEDGVWKIAVQLAEALDSVHGMGVCHRDLKPSNILMTSDGTPLLLDFNLCFDTRQTHQRFGGTLPYMAPEHLHAVAPGATADPTVVDCRSDLFAFGVIVYELLTGIHPFGPVSLDSTAEELRLELLNRHQQGATPVKELNPHTPTHLAHMVDRCLAYNPVDRPKSAAEILAAFRHEDPTRRMRSRWLARPLRLVIGSALLVVVLAGLPSALTFFVRPREAAFEAQFQRGLNSFRDGDYDRAVQLLDRVLQSNSKHPRAFFLRGRARQLQGDFHLAWDDYAQADKLTPDGQVKACQAYCMNRSSQHRGAILLYEQAIAAHFATAEVFNNLAYSHLQLDQLQHVETYLDRALAMNPSMQAAHYNRAWLDLRESGHDPRHVPRDGLKEIEIAIRLGPETAALYYDAACLSAAVAEHDDRQVDQTITYLEKAVHLGLDSQLLENDRAFQSLRGNASFQAVTRERPVRIHATGECRLVDPFLGFAEEPG